MSQNAANWLGNGKLAGIKWGQVEGMGLIQPGEETDLGEPNSSLMVSMRKLLGRWSQAVHRDQMMTNIRTCSDHMFSMRTIEQWIWLHKKLVRCFQPWKLSGPDWAKPSVTWSDLTYSVVSSFDPARDDLLRSSPTWIILLSYDHFYFKLVQEKQIEYLLIYLLSVI